MGTSPGGHRIGWLFFKAARTGLAISKRPSRTIFASGSYGDAAVGNDITPIRETVYWSA